MGFGNQQSEIPYNLKVIRGLVTGATNISIEGDTKLLTTTFRQIWGNPSLAIEFDNRFQTANDLRIVSTSSDGLIIPVAGLSAVPPNTSNSCSVSISDLAVRFPILLTGLVGLGGAVRVVIGRKGSLRCRLDGRLGGAMLTGSRVIGSRLSNDLAGAGLGGCVGGCGILPTCLFTLGIIVVIPFPKTVGSSGSIAIADSGSVGGVTLGILVRNLCLKLEPCSPNACLFSKRKAAIPTIAAITITLEALTNY